MNNEFKGTTICAVRKNGKTAIAGDIVCFSGLENISIGDTVLESTYDAATGKVTAVVPTALADGWHDAKIEVADNSFTATEAGEYELRITATDSLGNKAEEVIPL